MTDGVEDRPPTRHNKEIWIALIGAAATIVVALITGAFGLLSSDRPAGESTPAGAPAAAAQPVVTIEGPLSVPLGERAYFTIVSQNARRAEWSVGGFGDGQIFTVDPLPPSHQIWVNPTDSTRAGEVFTLAVTVFGADGQTASASKQFQVTANSP